MRHFGRRSSSLATPAYYRENEDLELGIRDVHEGTLTKDATRWSNTLVAEGAVKSAEIKFRSSREPWVYCASHYQLNRELRRLKDHFDEKHGYTAATRIRDPNAFATWLGIDFALNLDKTTHVKLGAHDKGGYALSLYNTVCGKDRVRSTPLCKSTMVPSTTRTARAASPHRKTGSIHVPARRRGSLRRCASRPKANTDSRFPRSATPSNRDTTSPCRRSYAD